MQPQNRKFYLLVAAFLLCAVLMGIFSAGRGKSSVEKWKEEMRAKGERFTIAELVPQRSGPATNRLEELLRLSRGLSALGNSVNALEQMRYLSNGVAIAVWAGTNLGGTIGIGAGRRGGIPSSFAAYEWDSLAADLSAAEGTLFELHGFLRTPDRDTGWNYDPKTPMPRCFVEKRTIAQWLAAANTHHLHAHELNQAVTNLHAQFDLTAWHSEDFSLVGQMIRVALGGLALHTTWATLQHPGLTDAQLAALQARLQTNVLLPGVLRSFEVERADMDQVFLSIRSGGETLKSAFGSGATGWGRVGEQAGAMGWRIFLSEADELFYLRNMQGQIDGLRLLLQQRDWSGVQTNLAAVRAELLIFDTWRGNLLLVSSMAIPNLSKAMLNSVRHEARRELTLAAVALERHRRRHGHHPDTLSQLVPEFLPAMPVDWMDGKPLRYRLNPDGTYTLWSVGEDFKDDGGDGTEAKPPTVGSQPDIWNGRDALWPRLPAGTPVP